MADHSGNGCIGAVHRHRVVLREILCRRLPVLVQAGENRLVGAVSIQECPAVRFAVVELCKPHSGYLGPLSRALPPCKGNCVNTLWRRRVEGHLSLFQVCRILDLGALHRDDLVQLVLRELELLGLAIRGILRPLLPCQQIHRLQKRAAASGRGRSSDNGYVSLHRRRGPLTVPGIVFRAGEDVELIGKAKHGGLAVVDGPLVRRRALLQIQVPQVSAAGRQNMVLPRDVAAPHPSDRVPGGQFRQEAVAGPDLQMVFGGNAEIAHLGGLSHFHVCVAVGRLVQAKPLLNLIDFGLTGADNVRHVTTSRSIRTQSRRTWSRCPPPAPESHCGTPPAARHTSG